LLDSLLQESNNGGQRGGDPGGVRRPRH